MAVLLGRTSAGTTADNITASVPNAWVFTASASGNLKTIYFNPKVANAGVTSAHLGIYSNSAVGDQPFQLLGSAAVSSGYGGSGQFYAVLATTVAITSGTKYHLALVANGETFDFQGDTLAAAYSQHALVDSTLPATWTHSQFWNTGAIIWGEDTEPVIPDIEYLGAGAVATGTAATIAPAIPTHAAGDMIVIGVGVKPDTATVANEAGWTNPTNGEAAGGGGTTGVDTGPTRVRTFIREATAAGTTVTLDLTGQNVEWAQALVFRKNLAGSTWGVAAANGVDSTTGTPFEATMGTNPGLAAKDMCAIFGCIPTDVTTPAQFSAHTLTATGITATVTEVSEPDTTLGNDLGGVVCTATIDTGTASAAPTVSMTAGGTTTNVRGPIVLVRLRAVPSGGLTQDISDTASLGDSVTSSSDVSRTLSEASLTLADSVSRQAEFASALADALALADAQTLALALAVSSGDLLSLADSISSAAGRDVSIGDLLSLADLATREAAFAAALADVLSLIDQTSLTRSVVTALDDVLVVDDARDVSLGTASTLADTLSLSDTTLREGGKGATLADTAALSDSAVTAAGSNLSLADPLSLADDLSRSMGLAVSDPLVLIDAVAFARELMASDALGLTDQQTLAFGTSVSLASTVTLSDGLTLASGFSSLLSDSISVDDATVLARGIQQSLADIGALADEASFLRGIAQLINDTSSVTDDLSFASSLTIPDVLVLADSTAFEATYFRSIADTAGLSDEALTLMGGFYIHHRPPLSGTYGAAANGLVVATVMGGVVTIIDASGVVVAVDHSGNVGI